MRAAGRDAQIDADADMGARAALGLEKRLDITDGLLELVQRRFDEVDPTFAAEEGEGDLSRAHWATVHEDCFTREGTYAPDMLLWCERFRLIEIIGEGADQ